MNIVEEIVRRRKKDAAEKGFSQGIEIPKKRSRPLNAFMNGKGVILEIKRASPSKGDIAPFLDAAETARKYRESGAGAISCLTEVNYFKGSLGDLIQVCNAVPDVAVLRKDFLVSEEEVEISYLCGADAVLLIAGILSLEKILSMLEECRRLGMSALVEVRSEDDAEKVLEAKKLYGEIIVAGVNSRNLKDFSIDLLVPAMLKKKIGGKVIFESGIASPEAAEKISAMGFSGLLLGEFAARNPDSAGNFIRAFSSAKENSSGRAMLNLAEKIGRKKNRTMIKVCGITRIEDAVSADALGADFLGFIFSRKFARNVAGGKFSLMKDGLKKLGALKVAVVTESSGEEFLEACSLAKEGAVDFVQLHGIGDEGNFLNGMLEDIPHYFAVTGKCENPSGIKEKLFESGEARVLLDFKNHLYPEGKNLWVAGGITAENVSDLIKKFRPELVDVSGGIEGAEIGIKDEEKMKRFFENVREAKS